MAGALPFGLVVANSVVAEYAVAAGGGGSGHDGGNGQGGAGGAGGLFYGVTQLAARAYPIVVGIAGIGGNATITNGGDGGPSSFNGLTALGGGGGGPKSGNGRPGGSGGGVGSSGAPGTGGAGTVGQGHDGGSGGVGHTGYGGGGALTAANTQSGGSGVVLTIDGTSKEWSRGGDGQFNSGTFTPPITPTNPGCGAYGGDSAGNGAAGAAGLVVISYSGTVARATGGTITTKTVNGVTYQVHTFTGSGTFTVLY